MKKTDVFQHKGVQSRKVGRHGYLTAMDAIDFMANLETGVADVVFLDPPFNLRKDYGFKCDLEHADRESYEHYLGDIAEEAMRVLRPGGALFLYHVPYWATRLSHLLHERMLFRHWIAVSMKNGFVRGRHLYPAHYALVYYTLGDPAVFRRPKLRPKKCRHCQEYVKDYGGYTDIIRRKGINLSDFWDDISPVRHARTKHRAANQLPELLTDRVLSIAGRRHGLLVDPFAGSGTSLVSAVRRGMHFVGNDLSRRNIRLCQNRITELASHRPVRQKW